MKSALQKSPIPKTHTFVTEVLKQPLFDPNWHFHSEYQIFIVLKGSGTRFIGDSVERFEKDNITFTGPNLPHLWRSDNENFQVECEGVVVYFHEDFISKNLLEKEEAIKLRQLLKLSLRGITVKGKTLKKVKKMILNLPTLEGFDGVLELLNILNCLSKSNDIELLASPGYTNSLKEGDTERMNKVYAHVMKNFKKEMALSELAVLTNMTPTSFSRYFKMHANKTFSEFVSEIRIGHACKLLIEKKMNASQACYASGFRTLSNFNRQFKTITKRSPIAYKKEYGV
tara:strand:- start:26402 stop:27256 length:855 start_codon:yes stop_codon:yes gene_type:complete